MLLLTTRHHLIDFVELFRGTLDGANVAPREVVKLVLARNAGAVILVHQHPSAVKDASQADELITATLKEALALIQVRVIDHIIVAGRDTLSFADRVIALSFRRIWFLPRWEPAFLEWFRAERYIDLRSKDHLLYTVHVQHTEAV